MSRRKGRGGRSIHVIVALIIAAPPCLRLGMHAFSRPEGGADTASDEIASLRVELEAAREELRIARLDLSARDLGHSLPSYHIVLAESLPVDDPSARRGSLWVSCRGASLVPDGTAAIAGEALVGRVARAHGALRLARIQTLLDPAFRVRFRKEGASGMLWGTGRVSAGESPVLELRHLSEGAVLASGEPVYTEGGDGIYPEGILIGFLADDGGAPPSSAAPRPIGPVPLRGLVVHAAAHPGAARRLALAVDVRKARLEEAVAEEARLDPALRARNLR